MIRFLQRMVATAYVSSCQRCNDWSGQGVARLRPQSLLDVGCADGSFLFNYLDYQPARFDGIEAAPELKARAEKRGLRVRAVDLNGTWPYKTIPSTWSIVPRSSNICTTPAFLCRKSCGS